MQCHALITVLTPTLNCRSTLVETLSSVERLDARIPGRVQHLIADGGSTDGTRELLREYSHGKAWAEVHDLPGENIPRSLNVLLPRASGRWILVLNGDDYILEDSVCEVLLSPICEATPRIVCGDVEVQSSAGVRLGSRVCQIGLLDRFMSVNHPAMLVDRSIFTTVGVFDAKTPYSYDYIWTWGAYKKSVAFTHVSRVLAVARLGGISQRRAALAAGEILRAKWNRGSRLVSLIGYAGFQVKRGVSVLLPEAMSTWLRKRYRIFKGSIDRY